MKHSNSGNCEMCQAILTRYPMVPKLYEWFKHFQSIHPEAHVSCAGRGQLDQEACFMKKASRAHYGQSAHNYGAALDIFEMAGESPTNIYENKWFYGVVQPALDSSLVWYGAPGAKFYELPHIELANWRELVAQGRLKLVE